jgi:phytanoyl-CoA dioxygenase PhyH
MGSVSSISIVSNNQTLGESLMELAFDLQREGNLTSRGPFPNGPLFEMDRSRWRPRKAMRVQGPLKGSDLLPSAEDVEFYREHGWYRSKKVIPDDLLDAALAASDRHFRGERDWTLPITTGFSNWKPEDGDVLRNAQAVALQNRDIRRLVTYPLIGAIAARLADTPAIRYFDDSILYKPPQRPDEASVVGWHTDRAYWGTCTSDRMLTAWIPFHDCPEELGPVIYVDGSHHWPGAAEMRTFHTKELNELESRFIENNGSADKYPMTLRRGEVSFHSCLTVHASEANRGSKPRIALALHMQDAENRFRHHLDASGEPWHLFNDDLARKLDDGSPDYADPDVFPLLWPSG